jgi:phosphoglycerate kinase
MGRMDMFKTLDDMTVAGQRVLVRGDLNLPVQDGRVTDTTRIDRMLPTLRELMEKGARVVVISHFGRPKGQVVPEMSLKPVADALSQALGGTKVAFAADCIGDAASAVVDGLADGEIALLENLRFHPGEEANDPGFAGDLAALGDIYVNDGFSVSHRAHASTEAIARLLPAAAGRNMQAELEALESALGDPKRPVLALVGGAKVSTKLAVLGNLIAKVDALVIGGGMANTFLHALGTDVGASLCESDLADTAREIMSKADSAGCEIILPSDVVIAGKLEAGAPSETVMTAAVPPGKMILDVGPDSAAALSERLGSVRTLLWNGPLGAFEFPPFDAATVTVAQAAAKCTDAGEMVSVAGGGDTVAALRHAGVADSFSYISTAGGAFLEWLEGKELPGVAALRQG